METRDAAADSTCFLQKHSRPPAMQSNARLP